MGRVSAPQGAAEIGFAFKRTPQGLVATMFMPVMFVYGQPLGLAQATASSVTIAPLDTVMKLEDGRLIGTFGLGRLPIVLERGGSFAAEPPAPSWPAGPAPRWSHALGAGAWATPVARDGVVFLGTIDGQFHAVHVTDGSDFWTWKGAVPLYGQALVADDSVLFVDAGNDLIGLDRQTGTLRWRVPLHDAPAEAGITDKSFTHRTPVPMIAGGVIYVGSPDGSVYAFEAATGRPLWRHGMNAPVYAGIAFSGSSSLVVGCFDGSLVTLDRRTGAETGRARVGGPIVSMPAISGDLAVVGSRDYLLYGVSLSRSAVAWTYSYWFSWVESAPHLADGVAYLGSSDFRRVGAFEPATGKALWIADVGGLTWGTPVVTADTIYAGTHGQNPAFLHHEGGVVALDRRSGAVKWRVRLTGPSNAERVGCVGSLALADHLLIAATFDGTLAAYPVD
jgi:outer membrane protein assembly factor BamB